jgi:DNA modification methylase
MRNEILQGDVIKLARTLAPESVNAIITSPPYFGLRDYDLPPTDWPEVSYAPMAGLPEVTIPAMTCCLGLEDSIEAYVGHMVLVFRELRRVLRDDGVGWLNLGDSYAQNGLPGLRRSGDHKRDCQCSGCTMPNLQKTIPIGLKRKDLCGIPWRIAFAIQADGWFLRSDIIWAKKNCMPESCQDRPTKAHEYLFLLAKSERYYYDQEAIREPNIWPDHNRFGNKNAKARRVKELTGNMKPDAPEYTDRIGRNKRTVWHLSSQPLKEAHFAVMPEALVEPCLLASCPAQVCVECGEPWVRVVDREPYQQRGDYRKHGGESGHNNPTGKTPGSNTRGMPYRSILKETFAPTCNCNAPTRPGVVLDPFFGSGTVGVVAKKHKRDWLGIELNPDYVNLARKRLDQTQPALFAT